MPDPHIVTARIVNVVLIALFFLFGCALVHWLPEGPPRLLMAMLVLYFTAGQMRRLMRL